MTSDDLDRPQIIQTIAAGYMRARKEADTPIEAALMILSELTKSDFVILRRKS